ncbi:MAG: type IV secretory system conjugative DNA transfer family protein [Oscillospiraceae bacterium]|nr:type IV secretory system conjugative DNA transfer family protein [Oscillospiraceae bacterium]
MRIDTKKIIIQFLPFVIMGLFATKLGQAYRLAYGTDFADKLTNIGGGVSLAFKNAMPSFHPFDLMIGMIFGGIIKAVVYFKGKNAKKYRKDVEYGSARWGKPDDIKPYVDPIPDNNMILTATESLTMNSRPSNPKYARNKNVLVIGGSGSGKTRFFVKPNIMQMHSSYVITDPKGTLVMECGKMLEDNKYRIKILNTIDFKKSMKYNPFVYIRSEKDILKFVTALINNTKGDGKSGDDFWQKAEQLLYQALIGYIWYEAPPDEQNMNTLVEMLNKMEVREDNENFKNAVDFTFETLEERDPQHFAVRQYKKYRLAAGKTAKSILISCGARLAPFDIAEIREMMSEDQLELDTLGGYKKIDPKTGKETIDTQKSALFVIISDTDSSFNFIVALMYSQLFNLLCDKADNDFGGRLPVHVRCLLDEFANIGMIPNFEKLIATIRSREISACVILQAQSQLKAIYKDNMDTIIGNMDTTLFLGGKEKTTLEEISKMLGKETIDMYNTSVTKGNSPSHGQNYQKLGKELMTVDEIAVMDGSRCIMQLRGERPFLSKKYDITRHKNYSLLADFNKNNLFNVEDFLSTNLKLKPDDIVDVFEIDLSS